MDVTTEILQLFLPKGILDHFDIVSFDKQKNGNELYTHNLILCLDEKPIIPSEYKEHPYQASGFMEARDINDYPIRDMLVTLRIRRRRWNVTIEGTTKKVVRDWSIIAQGTRMNGEYAAFLKEISRF